MHQDELSLGSTVETRLLVEFLGGEGTQDLIFISRLNSMHHACYCLSSHSSVSVSSFHSVEAELSASGGSRANYETTEKGKLVLEETQQVA